MNLSIATRMSGKSTRCRSETASAVLILACSLFLHSPCSADDDWYPFISEAPHEPGEFALHDWFEKPAGRAGRIRRDGDQLVYNGARIQLWGINNTFADCAPPHELARQRADFYAKYGLNSVRLHKYADGSGWAGILKPESFTEFDPEGLERMDYYISELKVRGIYVKLSPTFGPPRLGREDLERLPWVREFGEPDSGRGTLEIPHSGIFYAPEIQDIYIRQMQNLLGHRNPHTRLTYAEDPVIWDLEIINEQSILFYTSPLALEKSATLRKRVGRQFCDWLEARYGSEEELLLAWGSRALNSWDWSQNEALEGGTILPIGNPYFWNPTQLEGSEGFRRQRHLDTLEFLTELQRTFYARYVAAIRRAGYTGEISGSNWQAGRAFSHFANLWTDAEIGTVDRHNYFGGLRRDPATRAQWVQNESMLSRAGSGILSTGMQQVYDLPFMLSEWVHVWPNEWGVEGPALIAAYGLGLQGWDVSYLFQNRDPGRFQDRLGIQPWEVATPHLMGLFPAIARQIYRGDVRTATQSAFLNVHVPSLFQGEGLDFDDEVAQGYDEKSFETGKVGRRALAAVRVQVRFTDTPQPTPMLDLTPFQQGPFLTSSTGQLEWMEPASAETPGGFVRLNTPGTQAVIGFAGGRTLSFSDIEITLHSPFAAVYVTALNREEKLADASRVLVTALARARNTGQKFSEDGRSLLEPGQAPIRLEPVRFSLRWKGGKSPRVRALDVDGRKTETLWPVREGVVEIDTGKQRSPYNLIEF